MQLSQNQVCHYEVTVVLEPVFALVAVLIQIPIETGQQPAQENRHFLIYNEVCSFVDEIEELSLSP